MTNCVNTLINDDVRNNSAWNQRWFVSHRGRGHGHGHGLQSSNSFDMEKAKIEISYAISKAAIDPYNESPWRYFIAIIREQLKKLTNNDRSSSTTSTSSTSSFHSFLLECETKVLKTKEEFENSYNKDGKECTHLLSAYIDILEMKGDEESCKIASDLCLDLALRYDTVRKKYWNMRSHRLVSSHHD